MIDYEKKQMYKWSGNDVLKEGHTMFKQDVMSDLNTLRRLSLKLKSQLSAKDKEIDELKSENERTTKERDNHFHDIIKLENELSELKFENDQLLGQEEITAYDIGVFKRMKDELEALQAKMAEGIPVDITYTGSTNIITNLPNALYGKFILIRLNEKGDK